MGCYPTTPDESGLDALALKKIDLQNGIALERHRARDGIFPQRGVNGEVAFEIYLLGLNCRFHLHLITAVPLLVLT